jgi:hypothetical protein
MGKNNIMEMMGENRAKICEIFDNLPLKSQFFWDKMNYFLPKVIISYAFLNNLK